MLGRIRRFRQAFYRGPEFVGIRPWRRGRYQSPTLTAAIWVYALAVRHLTAAGGLLLLCAGLVTLYALFTLSMPIYILSFGLLALLASGLLGGACFRPRLSVRRDLPERLGAGASQTVRYTVLHRGKLPAWDVLMDPMPLPRALFFPVGRAFLPALSPGQSASLTTTIAARRRGRYTLPPPIAASGFPFHLWRWTSTGKGSRTLVVHPAFHPIRDLQLETGQRYQAGGVALSSQIGNSMELLGTRQYQDGDDPRRLHWRSWARTSYPVVKEFREEYLCRTALIVDTRRPPVYFWDRLLEVEDPVFEAALSLTAGIAATLSERDYLIDLFAAGPEVYRFQGGRSLGFLENILDILACLGPHHQEPFAEFTAELIEEIAAISSAVFVLLNWDGVRRGLIDRLQAAGVVVKAVLITRDGVAPPELGSDVQTIAAPDVLAGRCERL